MQKNIIVEKSISFSVSLIRFCERLEERKKFLIAKQLLRSGTSIGANVFEARHAESRLDFLHKMKIAVKEANETLYWLTLYERSENYVSDNYLKQEIEEIIKILSKIILSTGKKLSN